MDTSEKWGSAPWNDIANADACVVVRAEIAEGERRPMTTILLIDDDVQVRRLLALALEGEGYHVLTAEGGKPGLRLLEHREVDLILVDLLMPDMDGLELIPRLRKMRPASKIIAISGGTDQWDYLDAARSLGAHATLKKPFCLQKLFDAVAGQLKSSHP